jgi:hypothetical protein
MNIKEKWKINPYLSCPRCGKQRSYSDYSGYIKSLKNKILCMSCAATGKIITEETKRKMSISSIGKPKSIETRLKMSLFQKDRANGGGKTHFNYGRIRSDETKQKISLANIGKKLSREQIEKIIKSIETRLKMSLFQKDRANGGGKTHFNYGRIRSDETKQKISLANIGKKLSREQIEKIIKSNTGKKRSLESKKNISQSLIGKIVSLDARKNMSIAARKRCYNNPKYFDKIQVKSFKRKNYTMPDNSIVKIQGYENKTLDLLIKNENINYNDVKIKTDEKPIVQYDFDGIHSYYPDAFIVSSNTIIETKSKWTWNKEKDKNIAKIKNSLNCGYNYRLIIWDHKYKIIDIKYCPSDIDKIFISI